MAIQIQVYGADWCHDTQNTLRHLKGRRIPHEYINVDEDAAAWAQVMEWNAGKRITPTVIISSDQGRIILSEPENDELDRAIRQQEEAERAA